MPKEVHKTVFVTEDGTEFATHDEAMPHEVDAIEQAAIENDAAFDREREERIKAQGEAKQLAKMLNESDAKVNQLRAELEVVRRDAERYQFIRAGGAYIEPNEAELYMADDLGGKYYKDMRDFDMDIDSAIDRHRAAIASEAKT